MSVKRPTSASDKESNKKKKTTILEHLTCLVCLNLFEDPVSLPCGHSICRCCLDETLSNNRKCPSCRASVPSNVAIGKNIALAALVDEQIFESNAEDEEALGVRLIKVIKARGKNERVLKLIEAGADLWYLDDSEEIFAVTHAIRMGNFEAASALFDADPGTVGLDDLGRCYEGNMPEEFILDVIATACERKDAEMKKPQTFSRALHSAYISNHGEVCLKLLELGVKPDTLFCQEELNDLQALVFEAVLSRGAMFMAETICDSDEERGDSNDENDDDEDEEDEEDDDIDEDSGDSNNENDDDDV